MNKPLRKVIYWGCALSIYALMVTAVFVMLFELEEDQFFHTHVNPSAIFESQKGGISLVKTAEQSTEFSKILLPLGPDDGRLPGFSEIWDELSRATDVDAGKLEGHGFGGLQAVKDVAAFSQGSVAELFLSGEPLQAFRQGSFLLSLNNSGKVQIVDCTNPHEPKLSGLLPYRQVQYMEMYGEIAYLLLRRPDAQQDKLVIADLSNPHQPRELSRFNVPNQATSFFMLDHQLVVYVDSGGYKGVHSVHLFDITDDYRLDPLGSASSPSLAGDFVQYDDYLLIADFRGGLDVYDFINPLDPVLVASLVMHDVVKQLTRRGDTVFAMGEQKRIYAIDMHDPLHPAVSTVVEEANHSAKLMTQNDHLYYFTKNGYLRVFDPPAFSPSFSDSWELMVMQGELVPMQVGDGFTLLGESQNSLPAAVTDVQTLPDQTKITDKLFWRGFLVVLNEDGLLQFFRKGKNDSLELQESLPLPPAQRWMAASGNRLYVGGEATINVIAEGETGHFVFSGQLEFPGAESWDGLVVQKTLCVASGKEGVLCFSIEDPDQLVASLDWMIPQQLEPLVDVRLLARSGSNRVLAAAGSAGLLSGRVGYGGQLEFDGFMNFAEPIYALAVIEGFCLVSTGNDIRVIDIRDSGSLQNLGKIAFPGVTRFAVASPDLWAGYVPGVGWSVLPAPRIVLPGEMERLRIDRVTGSSELPHDRYRLKLFNDHDVITAPDILILAALPDDRNNGATHGLQ
ncbi:MAG: hypothetical protein KAU27_16090 [Desulfuromonadales bacterium]|nr:hypothetical protein [Desulfuromonadales bacterium]